MDSQGGPLFSLAYFCQGKTMEELRYSLFYTSLELEQTRMAAQEELAKRDDQLIQLKELLSKATKERDEAQEKCRKLFLEKLLLQQQQQLAPLSGVSGVEDERKRGIDSNNGFSSSDCEGSIVSSPVLDPIQQPQLPPSQSLELVPDKPLPEKGKLLQAVMKAGPLLQTLLLAGPLPQWRHPPPPLESFEIPPVTIPSPPPPSPQLLYQDSLTTINPCNTLNTCGQVIRKRGLYDASDSLTETKCRRLVLN
ncbi:protein enabled homolog [Hibiscus syriacus]|uniref:protein enabled homolog n=1 Tax=Hibiscus syriacus TaxID=106335 RepID=UPI001924F864|nr:protein enabled homolog [Hibiscus syriacus]